MNGEQKVIGKTRMSRPVGRRREGGCPGCESGIWGLLLLEVFDELQLHGKAINAQGIGCASGGARLLDVDRVGGAHGPAADYAIAIKRVHPDAFVFTTQGDSDCVSIGLSATLNAAIRGEKITVLMCNNACVAATGGQTNVVTPLGAVTPTNPLGRQADVDGYPLLFPELIAGLRGVAYSARAAVDTPAHRQQCKRYIKTAFEKQLNNVGFSYVEILIGCPTNRRLTPLETFDWVEKVQIPQFPLGEFKNVDMIV